MIFRPKFLLPLAAAAVSGAVLWLWMFDPRGQMPFPQCPWFAVTGLYCPGCGTLRALHDLLHGDVAGALHANALAVVAAPLLLIALISEYLLRRPLLLMQGRYLGWIVFAVVMLYWVARNIPMAPLNMLAPM